jgi:hypothetical protein
MMVLSVFNSLSIEAKIFFVIIFSMMLLGAILGAGATCYQIYKWFKK